MNAIENNVDDDVDQEILKYMLIGYEVKDVCDEMGISRKEFKHRMADLRENKRLELVLLSGIM